MPYTWYSDAFTSEECDAIANSKVEWEASSIVGQETEVKSIRDSRVAWISQNDGNSWMWERLAHFISEANTWIWRMEIDEIIPNIQLTHYSQGGHYDWHVDSGVDTTSYRKISCVLNLTDPKKYKGGGTVLKFGKDPVKLPMEKGTLNVFPSYTLHKAKRVKKGERKTLVAWSGGSPYK